MYRTHYPPTTCDWVACLDPIISCDCGVDYYDPVCAVRCDFRGTPNPMLGLSARARLGCRSLQQISTVRKRPLLLIGNDLNLRGMATAEKASRARKVSLCACHCSAVKMLHATSRSHTFTRALLCVHIAETQ